MAGKNKYNLRVQSSQPILNLMHEFTEVTRSGFLVSKAPQVLKALQLGL